MVEPKIEKQIVLPLFKSIQMCIQSIRIRFGRSLITTAGIMLAIAFVMAIFTSITIQKALAERGPADIQAELAGAVGLKAQQLWLISLSLLVCIVGITNAMLMSVTERYREIGTMKCLGALDSFVVRLFLIESAFQGIMGAIGGVILGGLGMSMVMLMRYGGAIFKIYPWGQVAMNGAIATIIGMVLAVVGAIYPAYRAAKMVPADAMRKEE